MYHSNVIILRTRRILKEVHAFGYEFLSFGKHWPLDYFTMHANHHQSVIDAPASWPDTVYIKL